MKKLMLFGAALVFSTAAHAATDCYQLSADEGSFSRTPEMLCVTLGETTKDAEITLVINEVGNRKTVGMFRLDLLQRARCIDCNKDLYGVSNPSNSVFNKLKIEFDGKKDRNVLAGQFEEKGKVKIGENLFYYRGKPKPDISPNKDFPSQCNCPAYTHPVPLGPQNCTCEPD